MEVTHLEPVPEGSLAQSPLKHRVVFVVGAPAAVSAFTSDVSLHPPGAAVIDSGLHEHGFATLIGSFLFGHEPGPGEGVGLASLFDRGSLAVALRRLADGMLRNVVAGDGCLYDVSPGNAEQLDVIGSLFPDARLLHVRAEPASEITAALARGGLRNAFRALVTRETLAKRLAQSPMEVSVIDIGTSARAGAFTWIARGSSRIIGAVWARASR